MIVAARPAGTRLRAWVGVSALIAAALLVAVWLIARSSTPDPTRLEFPGLTRPGEAADVVRVIGRNLLVLALHSLACVAGYLAGKSLPEEAQRYRGVLRVIHDHAGPAAIAFVSAATLFSLATQALVLGSDASTLAAQGGISPALLLIGLLPHAIPELVAVFLPLAAWLLASGRGEWETLRRATVVTTLIALPIVVASAFVEVYVSPEFVLWLRSLHFV